MKGLVLYKHSSRRSVLLGSQYRCCIRLRCLQIVLNPGATNLDLRSIIICEYLSMSNPLDSQKTKLLKTKMAEFSKNNKWLLVKLFKKKPK